MAVKYEDLPLWAKVQAQKKLAEQERRRKPLPCPPADKPGGKYHNQKDQRETEGGGKICFDSRKEARRFDELLALLRAGQIRDLKLQPQFTLQEAYTTAEGVRVRAIRYQADFMYHRELSRKGFLSPVSRTKAGKCGKSWWRTSRARPRRPAHMK